MTSRAFSFKKAFTLTELLIVMMVIGLAAAFSISSLVGARRNAEFKQSVNTAVDFIQDARSQALSNREITLSTGSTYVADAFYVTVDTITNTLSLYAHFQDTSVADELLESATLDEALTILMTPSDLEEIYYAAPGGELDLVFTATSSVELMIDLSSGPSQQIITLDERSGVPEIVN